MRLSGTLAVVAALAAVPTAGGAAPATTPMFRALVFTKTTGYRHDSIPAAIAAVEALGAQNGFAVDQTEDAGAFTDANLARYRVVVFLLTTGDVLDDDQQSAMQRFVEAGNGWVGVHSAADTEYDWPWYGGLLGAWFDSHPAIQQATLTVADRTHPSTAKLPAAWTRTDEWYAFQTNPRPAVHVLLTIDESTYDAAGASMGADHPLAWWHDYDGGRAFYTALGHTTESYSEPLFLAHLLGGIEWAAGMPTTPRLAKVATALRGRRVVVTATHPTCACDAAVHVRGATIRTPALSATTAVTTPALPRGRWTVAVTLTSRTTGAAATARRVVTIR
jgi:type 1 glutamine amidotransferase